jgi:hypothetical protein
MNKHLDAGRIARCILGDADAEDRAHLALCSACRVEVEEFGQTLRAFRGSVRDWSQCDLLACECGPKWVGRSALGTPCCIAVTLLLCLTGMAASLRQRSNRSPTRAASDPDSVLLEQVRADVARRVPGGMEPLLNLISSPENVPDQPLP